MISQKLLDDLIKVHVAASCDKKLNPYGRVLSRGIATGLATVKFDGDGTKANDFIEEEMAKLKRPEPYSEAEAAAYNQWVEEQLLIEAGA